MRLLHSPIRVLNVSCYLLLASSLLVGPQGVAAQPQAFSIYQKDESLQTLGDLKPPYIDFSSKTPPQVSVADVIRRYVALIRAADDSSLRVRALHRMAGLELLLADQQINDLVDPELWQIAIDSYNEVLKLDPRREDRDELLYQLAHAHEMKGELQESLEHLKRLVNTHPSSRYFLESQFRVAELEYGFGNYLEAELAYNEVLKHGEGSAFSGKAQYMLGWSLFKQDLHDKALTQYIRVLDELGVETEQELSSIDQELLEDTLRIMSVIFSYRSGAEAVADLLDRTGRDQYAVLLYGRLSDHYMDTDRYQDVAETARSFIQRYPTAPQAPLFAVRRIEAFQQGDFPAQIWPEKEQFVEAYGIYSDYWQKQTSRTRAKVAPYLKTYLDELGRLHYSQAQQSGSSESFAVAAAYFRQFVEAFPRDETAGSKYFLLGEALASAGRLEPAIVAYEKAAYEYAAFEKRAEAAYAAIVAYDQLIRTATDQTRESWKRRRLPSLIRFADEFPQDSRTASLLVIAANDQLAYGEYKSVLATSQRVTKSKQKQSTENLRGAWLAHGNAAFEIGLYNEAEASLKEALRLWSGSSAERKAVEEKLAAAVYRQGEVLLAQNHSLEAVEQLLRVGQVAPQSEMRARAHYDAVKELMQAKLWSRAIEVMADFRRLFPKHELSADIRDNLIFAYEQNQQPDLAARELLALADSDPDTERRRKALLQASDLLASSGKTNEALNAYQTYVSRYPRPYIQAAEIHRRMVDMFGEKGDLSKRRQSLEALMKIDREAGSEGSDRTRYLAAEAAWMLAQEQKKHFDGIRLTLPLDRSLAAKRKAMDEVMAMLKRTNDYGVPEYSTAATHMSGEVYRQLSQDLLKSARPKGLSELELEQYSILLEEQAFPFEEKAIEFYELNALRTRNGLYDKWVKESFSALSTLIPARYEKSEMRIHVVSQLR